MSHAGGETLKEIHGAPLSAGRICRAVLTFFLVLAPWNNFDPPGQKLGEKFARSFRSWVNGAGGDEGGAPESFAKSRKVRHRRSESEVCFPSSRIACFYFTRTILETRSILFTKRSQSLRLVSRDGSPALFRIVFEQRTFNRLATTPSLYSRDVSFLPWPLSIRPFCNGIHRCTRSTRSYHLQNEVFLDLYLPEYSLLLCPLSIHPLRNVGTHCTRSTQFLASPLPRIFDHREFSSWHSRHF